MVAWDVLASQEAMLAWHVARLAQHASDQAALGSARARLHARLAPASPVLDHNSNPALRGEAGAVLVPDQAEGTKPIRVPATSLAVTVIAAGETRGAGGYNTGSAVALCAEPYTAAAASAERRGAVPVVLGLQTSCPSPGGASPSLGAARPPLARGRGATLAQTLARRPPGPLGERVSASRPSAAVGNHATVGAPRATVGGTVSMGGSPAAAEIRQAKVPAKAAVVEAVVGNNNQKNALEELEEARTQRLCKCVGWMQGFAGASAWMWPEM